MFNFVRGRDLIELCLSAGYSLPASMQTDMLNIGLGVDINSLTIVPVGSLREQGMHVFYPRSGLITILLPVNDNRFDRKIEPHSFPVFIHRLDQARIMSEDVRKMLIEAFGEDWSTKVNLKSLFLE